jgi:hypothetical protein
MCGVQRSMIAMLPSSWRSLEAGVKTVRFGEASRLSLPRAEAGNTGCRAAFHRDIVAPVLLLV